MKSRDRRKIKGIELGFENVTGQFIPYEHIVELEYTGVKTTLHRPLGWKDLLSERITCDSIYVRLSSKMKNMRYEFYKDMSDLENDTVFERIIKGKDIVDVAIVYSDNSREAIYIPWEDEDSCEEQNKLLKIDFEDGDLIIKAKEKLVDNR